MAIKRIINPSTGDLDAIGGDTNTGGVTIPQLSSDPAAPSAESAWVLKTGSGAAGGGKPIGLLISLTTTGAGGSLAYQFSYRTLEGTTKRVTIS